MKKYIFILCFCSFYNWSFSQQTVGLFLNDSLSYNGYTLFAPASSRTTYLIDNCGYVINTWESAYRPGEVAYLLENGNLLRACQLGSNTFFGGGIGGRLEIHDWDNNLLWAYNYNSELYHQHHDLEYLPSGNILLIAWEYRTEAEAIDAGRNPSTVNIRLWPTQIIELQPVGADSANIVWEWHLWDHLIQDYDSLKENYGVVADHPELIDINYNSSIGGGPAGNADWVHANSVDYNPELDQIIINSRYFSEFWIIDHSTTTEEAAGHTAGNSGKGGDILYRWGNPRIYDRGENGDRTLFSQHDAHWITEGLPDAGKIMIYNNGTGRPDGNYSSVDIIEPPVDATGNYQLNPGEAYGPNNLYWTYKADPPNSFYSSFISGAQRLPNGNTLVCEGSKGRFFEVDMNGELHWEYLSPIVFGDPATQGQPISGQNSVFRTYRYALDYPAFEGRDLTPLEPIELEPLPSDCELFTSLNDIQIEKTANVYPNPVSSYLNVETYDQTNVRIAIYDVSGKALHESQYTSTSFQINTQTFPKGIYFIHFYNKNNTYLFVKKIIKM